MLSEMAKHHIIALLVVYVSHVASSRYIVVDVFRVFNSDEVDHQGNGAIAGIEVE
jgi:hypothetical protein